MASKRLRFPYGIPAVPDPLKVLPPKGGRHRGKFRWKKYSRYNGNLREYWESKWRVGDHHLPEVYGFDD